MLRKNTKRLAFFALIFTVLISYGVLPARAQTEDIKFLKERAAAGTNKSTFYAIS